MKFVDGLRVRHESSEKTLNQNGLVFHVMKCGIALHSVMGVGGKQKVLEECEVCKNHG